MNLVEAAAGKHASPKILVAALKFFLGQDEAAEAAAEAGDEDSDSDEDKPKTGAGTKAGTSSGVSKEDVYRADLQKVRKKKRFFRFFFGFFSGPAASRPRVARARADRFSSPARPRHELVPPADDASIYLLLSRFL